MFFSSTDSFVTFHERTEDREYRKIGFRTSSISVVESVSETQTVITLIGGTTYTVNLPYDDVVSIIVGKSSGNGHSYPES